MPHFRATDKPVWWAVGDPVVASGMTEAGGLTVTGLTLISAENENTFLGLVAGSAGNYDPIPNTGEWCAANAIYSYGNDLVICRQSHTRTIHAPADIPALFAVYREDAGEALDWIANEPVEVGTRRLYDNTLYECLQAHQTQTDWTPPQTLGTLWGIVSQTDEWTVGVAYGVGDLVTYENATWECGQAHTAIATWYPGAPGVYLWSQV